MNEWVGYKTTGAAPVKWWEYNESDFTLRVSRQGEDHVWLSVFWQEYYMADLSGVLSVDTIEQAKFEAIKVLEKFKESIVLEEEETL